MKKVIGFFPMRAGSKSIPGKNKRPFFGRPLFYYQLSAMVDNKEIDDVFVYTDDEEILMDIEENWSQTRVLGVHRNPDDATDSSSTEDAMLNFLSVLKPDDESLFVLAQATNPFITFKDYDNGLDLVKRSGSAVLSVSTTDRFYWREKDAASPVNYNTLWRPRRQDFETNYHYAPLYIENGGFYVNTVKNIVWSKDRIGSPGFSDIKLYVMPSWTSTELDEELDWKIAEMVYKERML